MEFKFQIDFENKKSMTLFYKPEIDTDYIGSIEIPNILNFIDPLNNFFTMGAHQGKKQTFKIEIVELKIFEKLQKLDVDQSLLISNHLVEEIFNKVGDFTTRLSEDKSSLLTIFEGYTAAYQKANRFQALIVDLFRGTRKFEEGVIENLSKFNSINPDNLPKMIIIKNYFDTIKKKQKSLYDRFSGTKDYSSFKKALRKMNNFIHEYEKSINELTNMVDSEDFIRFFKKTDSLIKIIDKLDFQQTVEDV